MRRYLVLAVAAVVVAGGLSASAATPSDEEATYTGCLTRGGAITEVAIGEQPRRKCGGSQVQISWSTGVSPAEFAALAERVTALEEAATQPLALTVDCGAGESLSAALVETEHHPGPVDITISGVCEESAFVGRDDVSFTGVQRSDGISVPTSGPNAAVGLFDAHRITFTHLTITGGSNGMFVRQSSFTASDITVRDSGDRGITASDGSSGFISDCILSGHPRFGGETETESILTVRDCEITDNGDIGLFAGGNGGATIYVQASEVVDNGEIGLAANPGGSLSIDGTLVRGHNYAGVSALSSDVSISEASRIVNNDQGVNVGGGSTVSLEGKVVIEDNASDGISASGGSAVSVSDTIVRGNGGNGISVADLSTVSAFATTQAVDNGGWGIRCDGPPAIAVLGGQGLFDPAELTLTGNASGATNCG